MKKANVKPDVDPFYDPLSIGNLAISRGYATPEDIQFALQKQEIRQPLGRILVEENIITDIQLGELLHEQEVLKLEKDRNKVTRVILLHQRRRIKDMSRAIQDLGAMNHKFANGKT